MVRIAHFSDLHYGPKNLIEADRCFGTAIDMAMASGVQAAVLSGDSTDHALDLHSPAAERLVAQALAQLDAAPTATQAAPASTTQTHDLIRNPQEYGELFAMATAATTPTITPQGDFFA